MNQYESIEKVNQQALFRVDARRGAARRTAGAWAQAAARIKAALYSLLIVIAIAVLGDESECRLV